MINDNDLSVLKQVVMAFESTFCKTEQVFNKAEGHGGFAWLNELLLFLIRRLCAHAEVRIIKFISTYQTMTVGINSNS